MPFSVTADGELREMLRTSLRPVALTALRALEKLVESGLELPRKPIPGLALGPDIRAWVNDDIEWDRLGRQTMQTLGTSGPVFGAEAAVASVLGVEGPVWMNNQRPWSPQGQVVDAFVADFLRRFTLYEEPKDIRAALQDPEQVALDDALDALIHFLTRPNITGRVLAPLENFNSDSDVIELDDATRIVRFDESLKQELWAEHGWGGVSAMPLQLMEITDWHCAVEVDVASQTLLAGPDWAAAQHVLDDVVSALRLVTPGAVRTRRQWLRLDEAIAHYGRRLNVGVGLYGPPWWYGPTGFRQQLQASDEVRLREAFARLRTFDYTADHRFALARRRFDLSYGRDDDEDRLVDHWIAFEALFVNDTKTELRYRASLRVARFVGDTSADRRAVFATLQRSYDWRSIVVHGASPSSKTTRKLGTLGQTAHATEDILRHSLTRWLDPATSHDLAAIDDQLLE